MTDTSAESAGIERTGGCACGAVRFVATGEPLRMGLCHCLTCQRAHAAAYNPFIVYNHARVRFSGEMRRWNSSPDYQRLFCTTCGSPVIGITADEVELSPGGFDEPVPFVPQYESWVIRRLAWVPALDVVQFQRDREA